MAWPTRSAIPTNGATTASLKSSAETNSGNVERARKFEFNRELAKIGKPVDRGEWDMTPPTVNAYYNPQMNDINFPAGVLQPPAFDPELRCRARTMATPAARLATNSPTASTTKAVSSMLRAICAIGGLPEDGKEFEKRASCISDQYSTYTIIDDIKINGKLTLGEDVADLGGLILAYMAWKDDTKGQNLQPHRRSYARPEILRGLRPKLVRRNSRRDQAVARNCRSALSREISNQWRGLEHAGISGGVPLQGGLAHGESEPLPRLVTRCRLLVERS